MLIEIPGPESAAKADALASKLKEVFQNEFTVNRPVRKGEVRVVGLDDSVSQDEVACVIE